MRHVQYNSHVLQYWLTHVIDTWEESLISWVLDGSRHAYGCPFSLSRVFLFLLEGNVFRGVCQSTSVHHGCGGGEVEYPLLRGDYPLGGSPIYHPTPQHCQRGKNLKCFCLIWCTPSWIAIGNLVCLRKLHRYQLDYNSCVATNLPFFVQKAKSLEMFQESVLSLLVFPKNLYYLFPESIYLHACFFTRESLVTETVINVSSSPPTHTTRSLPHTDRAHPAYTPRPGVTCSPTGQDTFNKRTGGRCLQPLWWAISHWSNVTCQNQSTEDVDQHC